MHGRVNKRQMRTMLICLMLTHSKEEEEEEVENKDGDTRENYLNCTEGEL